MDNNSIEIAPVAPVAPVEATTAEATSRRAKGSGRKKANGQGTAYRRGRRWTGQVSLRGADGLLHRRTVSGPTERDVLRQLDELRRQERETGVAPTTATVTLGAHLSAWLEAGRTRRGEPLAARTLDSYRSLVRRFVANEPLARVRLQDLRPPHVRTWLGALERRGVSAVSRRDARRALSVALTAAVEDGFLPMNAVARVPAPTVEPPKRTWMDAAALGHLLEVAATLAPMPRALVTLAAVTGLRWSELAALAWQHVDLEEGCVSVERVLVEISGKTSFNEEPKTAAGRRVVSIGPEARAALRALRGTTLPHPSKLLFASSSGRPLLRSNTTRRILHPALRAAGLPAMGWHSLRRAHASILFDQQANPKAVARRLGHAKPSFTLDTYVQAGREQDEALARLTSELLTKRA